MIGPVQVLGHVNQWFTTTMCDPRDPKGCPAGAVFALPVGAGNVFHFGALGRNVIIGPKFANTDFSVLKTTKILERARLQFRAEVFDIFNHTNFGQPGRVAQVSSTTLWRIARSPLHGQGPCGIFRATMTKPRIAILISGRGSNMVAVLDAIREGRLDAEVAVVISNVESAGGLMKARERGVETLVISHKGRAREVHDREIVAELRRRDILLVCLAGYMRLLSPLFVRGFENRILNIHPSLLPAFPGIDAQRQALDHGVKITGCTVHLVDERLDHGPIVMQRAVEVLDGDTVETLSARILEQEHRIYPDAIALVLSKGFRVEGRRTFFQYEI